MVSDSTWISFHYLLSERVELLELSKGSWLHSSMTYSLAVIMSSSYGDVIGLWQYSMAFRHQSGTNVDILLLRGINHLQNV